MSAVDQLADPRLISIDDLVTELSSSITDLLLTARDDTTERLLLQYRDAPIAGVSNFDTLARASISNAFRSSSIDADAEDIMAESIRRTIDRLGSDVHAPRIDRDFGTRDRQQSRSFGRNIVFAVRTAADDMVDRMRTNVRHGAMGGETIDNIIGRIEDEFSASDIRKRARLIARMEIQTAVQSVKLDEYERHPDVDGVRVINPCTQNTTRLCRDLAGCGPGDAAVAWFDDDASVSDQLQSHVSADLLYEGFKPIPPIPPFHWNCRSGLAPVLRDQ